MAKVPVGQKCRGLRPVSILRRGSTKKTSERWHRLLFINIIYIVECNKIMTVRDCGDALGGLHWMQAEPAMPGPSAFYPPIQPTGVLPSNASL